MLLNSSYINSLAEAIFGYFKEKNKITQLIKDIENFNLILKTHEGERFLSFLNDLWISRDEKIHFVETVFKTKINKILLYFFTLVIKNGCEGFFQIILNTVIRVYKKDIREETIYFESFYPLKLKQMEEYVFFYFPNIVKLYKNKLVKINVSVNQDLLGGFRIKVGNRTIDNSYQAVLEKIAENLKSNGDK